MTLYAMLNQDAKHWWYHAKLRRDGNPKEARRRERASIRSSVRQLRETLKVGGFIQIGRGGWTLHMSDASRLENRAGRLEDAMPQACLRLGIPVLDTLTIPEDRLTEIIRIPMVGIQRTDAEPWHGFSYAPFAHVARLYVELGATMYNYALPGV